MPVRIALDEGVLYMLSKPYRVSVIAAIALAVLPVLAAPATAGTPAAVWNMDEASGSTMNDSSGNGNHGSATNVTFGEPGFTGLGSDLGYGFWTKPAIVTVPDDSSLDPGTAPITITADLKMPAKPSATVGDFDVIRKGLAGTSGGDWKMEVLDNGYLFCRFRGSAGAVTWRHSPNLADNSWHTVSCSRSATQLTLTVDGTSWSKSATTGSIANGQPVLLGTQSSTGVDQYTGVMDNVSVTIG